MTKTAEMLNIKPETNIADYLPLYEKMLDDSPSYDANTEGVRALVK